MCLQSIKYNKSCNLLILLQTVYPFYRQLINELSLYDTYQLSQTCSSLRCLLKPLLRRQSLFDRALTPFVRDVTEFRKVLQENNCCINMESLYTSLFEERFSLAGTCSQSISRQSLRIVSYGENSIGCLVSVLVYLLSQGYHHTEYNGVGLPVTLEVVSNIIQETYYYHQERATWIGFFSNNYCHSIEELMVHYDIRCLLSPSALVYIVPSKLMADSTCLAVVDTCEGSGIEASTQAGTAVELEDIKRINWWVLSHMYVFPLVELHIIAEC